MEKNLTPEERETLINWADDEERIFIYTTQKKMMNKLRKNPIFEIRREIINNNYSPTLIGLEGYLPIYALSLRTKQRKVRLSDSSRANLVQNQ